MLAACLAALGCSGGGGSGTGSQIDMLEQDLAALQESLSEAQADLAAATTRATTAETDLATARTNLRAATTRADTAETDLATATARASTAETDLETAQTNLAAATTRATTAETSLATAQANLAAANRLVSDTQTALETAQANLAAAITRATTAETSQQVSAAQLTAAQELIKRIDADLTQAKADRDAAVTARDTALTEKRTAEAARDAALTAKTTAEAALKTAQDELEDAQDEIDALESRLALREEEEDDNLPVDQDPLLSGDTPPVDAGTDTTTPTTRRPTTPTTGTAESNQRAENLRRKLTDPAAITLPLNAGTVEVTVPTRGSVRLTRGGHRTATLSGNGMRSATMALTVGGDSGKTVVYTDRETTRLLLEHYGTARDTSATGDETRFDIAHASLGLTGALIPQTSRNWKISHGVSTSVAGVHVDDDNDPQTPSSNDDGDTTTTDPLTVPTNIVTANTKPARDFYTGSLHGVGGRFVCGGVNCQIQVTPAYATSVVNGRVALNSVTLTNVGGTGLYFKPSSAASTIPLYDGGPVEEDGQYMVFGWWKEEPTSASGDYVFGTFAEAIGGTAANTSTLNATYDGTAAGMYVEQDPNDPVDTHRQGEFTADVNLSVTAGTVTGSIDDFVTTPTGGSAAPVTATRWLVRLSAAGEARIENMAGSANGTGNWSSAFVAAHATAAADTEPPAIVGAFNARIVDSIHIAGAFGAEIR